jgi:hypothetical protein
MPDKSVNVSVVYASYMSISSSAYRPKIMKTLSADDTGHGM